MVPGSFDDAVAGCAAVVHAAASVVFNHPDPQKGIVDPSIEGTRNVLESVRKAGTVRRVVHTSSMVAVYGWDKPRDHVFTEADWNSASTLKNDPYGVAKVGSERAARAYVDALPEPERFELIHLNPGMVFGPPLIKSHAKASPRLVRDVISRAQPGVPRLMLSVVDVRDVAAAHVAALQHADPPARCLIFAENAWMTDLMAELQEMFTDVRMGAMAIPKPVVLLASLTDPTLNIRQLWHLVGRPMPMDNTRSRDAYGMVYRPVADTLRDTATPMIEHGWARVKRR
jgi:dihydroflavonol-4-reductase